MNAFLTGSRAYGTPRHDSDVDVVLLTDRETAAALQQAGTEVRVFADGGWSVHVGPINIIGMSDSVQFAKWREGTDHLKTIAPVTREQAVEYLTSIGLTNQGVSGNE